MTMKMNKSMVNRWQNMHMESHINTFVLSKRLNDLAESDIVDTSYGVVLQPLLKSHFDPCSFHDQTGFEAFINKIHISDFVDQTEARGEKLTYLLVQAVLYVNRIKDRLSERSERFTILLSFDPDSEEITVRFFMVRPNESWGLEDIDEYILEDVIVQDTLPSGTMEKGVFEY